MKITQKLIGEISFKIIGCAIEVHKHLGPGLLESVYQMCLIEELKMCGLKVESEMYFPILYKGKKLENKLRLDLVVEELIIVELKAVEKMIPLYNAQLLSYLKLTGKPKGLLFNFNCENIRKEMDSFVTREYALLPNE
ncbi:MAG: GxxExxY protein [Bacteroidales bacterium]